MQIHRLCQFTVALALLTNVSSFAFGELYSAYWTGQGSSTLVKIDEVTAAVTPIGFLDGFRTLGLAWDSSTKTLYAVAERGGTYGQLKSLIEIDPKTAVTSLIGALGSDSVVALTYHPINDILYGGVGVPSRLATVDRITGVAHVFGEQEAWLAALEYVPSKDRLVYAGGGAFEFGHVDPDTGATTALDESFPEVYGLAFDPSRSTLFALTGDSLLRIDPDSGEHHLISMLSPNPSGRLYAGLVYVPIPEPSSLALTFICFTLSAGTFSKTRSYLATGF